MPIITTLEPIPEQGIAAGEGSQSGTLYFNLANVGIINYDLPTSTSTPTGVQSPATALGYGGDGFWHANGGASAPRDLYMMLPEDPTFPAKYLGTGTRVIEDIAVGPNGTMYGVGESHLFTIDRENGRQTDIGSLGYDSKGLAFMNNGKMYAVDGVNIMEVDPATLVSTFEYAMDQGIRDLASEPGYTGLNAPASSSKQKLLLQNYPNPFNPSTSIRFVLEEESSFHLSIHNVAGRKVRDLFDGTMGAGSHEILWDARAADDQLVSSGVYYAVLVADRQKQMRKMVLAK